MSATRKSNRHIKKPNSEINSQKTIVINKTRKMTKDKWTINPNVVLAFISKNHEYLPTVPNYGDYSIEEDIFRVRIILWQSAKKFKTYAELAKKSNIPVLSEVSLISILNESKEKKYRERGSPPFSSNKLCGSSLKGNDGKMYISTKNKANICTWIPN